MARLRYVEKETATPEQDRVLTQFTQKSGKIANIWKLWRLRPRGTYRLRFRRIGGARPARVESVMRRTHER